MRKLYGFILLVVFFTACADGQAGKVSPSDTRNDSTGFKEQDSGDGFSSDADQDSYADVGGYDVGADTDAGHFSDADADSVDLPDAEVPDSTEDTCAPSDEICNGLDDDCDGDVDEDLTSSTYYADSDGDGQGDPDDAVEDCGPPDGYVDNADDCDDADPNTYKGASDNFVAACMTDADGDGVGDANPSGSGVFVGNDCDDSDPNINPDANEICNGLDDDCDGDVDEDLTQIFYADQDGDGYGDSSSSVDACTAPSGFVANADDCDDDNDEKFPGNAEVCDAVDNNCNGQVDEGVTMTFYADSDDDGFRDPNDTTEACSQPSGYLDASAPVDSCPFSAEDGNVFDGCPDAGTDSDGDGLLDIDDLCPQDAEDDDGYEDSDGCPEAAECDQNNLNGSCADYGYDKGSLSCSGGQHDVSGCADYVCGDGAIDPGEVCDNGASNGQTCTPGYGQSCTYCKSDCTEETLQGGSCGDGVLNGPEACEAGVNDCYDSNGDGIITTSDTCEGCDTSTCQPSTTEPYPDQSVTNRNRFQDSHESWTCYSDRCCPALDSVSSIIVTDQSDVGLLTDYCKVGRLEVNPSDGDIDLSNTVSTIREVTGLFFIKPIRPPSSHPLYRYYEGPQGSSVPSLTPFQNLRSVGGNFHVIGGSDVANVHTEILNFDGLTSLESIGGNLVVRSMDDPSPNYRLDLQPKLTNLQSVGGKVQIENNGTQTLSNGVCQDDALDVCAAYGKTGNDCEVNANWAPCP